MFDEFIRGPGLPFHFWSPVFLMVGAIVGSFLNVCIYRMPRDESLVTPGSHCPHCGQAIPLRLNVPLVSWWWLRARSACCGKRISSRYFFVELLTAVLFLACWLVFGRDSGPLAVVMSVFMAGLVVATFIDLDHFIIPDEITLGGLGAGILASFFVPELHQAMGPVVSLQRAFIGAAVGAGMVFGVLRLGKLLLGRQTVTLPPGSRVVFGELDLFLPDQVIPYNELLYRESDAIKFHAQRIELPDRCLWNVPVRLTKQKFHVGTETFLTEAVPGFEAILDVIVLPREAMGLGDVKFMAAIGAFLGWKGVVFALFASAVLGSVLGFTEIALGRRDRSRPIPYGPYIAAAAAIWAFTGTGLLEWWLRR